MEKKVQSEIKGNKLSSLLNRALDMINGKTEPEREIQIETSFKGLVLNLKDVSVRKGIKYFEDDKKSLLRTVEDLKKGEPVIIDFSENDSESRVRIYNVLYGVVATLNGAYKIIDEKKDLVFFICNKDRYSEYKWD